MNTALTTPPETYTPPYCAAIHELCGEKMEGIERKVCNLDRKIEKIDARFWTLILLAGSNLIATIGGLIAYIWSLPH